MRLPTEALAIVAALGLATLSNATQLTEVERAAFKEWADKTIARPTPNEMNEPARFMAELTAALAMVDRMLAGDAPNTSPDGHTPMADQGLRPVRPDGARRASTATTGSTARMRQTARSMTAL